jgi:Tfp pilus assembly protein PilO
MKIAGIEVTNKQITMVSAAVIMVAGMHFIFCRPIMKDLKTKVQTYRVLDAQVRDARGVIASAGKITEERDLLSEREVSVAIDELAKTGKSMTVAFQSIRPRELAQGPDPRCKVLPVDLTVEATDRQMVSFMGALDDLKRNLITISSFDVVPDKDDPTKLRATMTVNLYFLSSTVSRGK